MTTIAAVYLVLHELDRAEAKHPAWPSDVIHADAIVAEEAGETVKAALDHAYHGAASLDDIRTEAVHTAATAIRLIMNLDAPMCDTHGGKPL